ncbi:hypothetical protein B0H12DRAFT_1143992, partial [Mycena haematopus]
THPNPSQRAARSVGVQLDSYVHGPPLETRRCGRRRLLHGRFLRRAVRPALRAQRQRARSRQVRPPPTPPSSASPRGRIADERIADALPYGAVRPSSALAFNSSVRLACRYPARTTSTSTCASPMRSLTALCASPPSRSCNLDVRIADAVSHGAVRPVHVVLHDARTSSRPTPPPSSGRPRAGGLR